MYHNFFVHSSVKIGRVLPYPNQHSASETEEVPKSHECREVPQKNCSKERKLQVLTGDQLSITICTCSCNTQFCVPSTCWWSWSPQRVAGVWAHTAFPSLCLLPNNTWLCPLWAQSSPAGRTGSWVCLCRWRCGSCWRGCGKCHYYNTCIPSALDPSLGPGGSSSYHNHW